MNIPELHIEVVHPNAIKLLIFLQDRGILEQWVEGFSSDYTRLRHVLTGVALNDPRNLIERSFVWHSTKEGSFFWESVDREWRSTNEFSA